MTIKTQAEAEETLRGILTRSHSDGPEAQAKEVIAALAAALLLVEVSIQLVRRR